MTPEFYLTAPQVARCIDNEGGLKGDLTIGKLYTISKGFFGLIGAMVFFTSDQGHEDWCLASRFVFENPSA